MALKVAIVGLSASSRHLIPWGSQWELWGLMQDADRYHFHRVFEIHTRKCLELEMQGAELEEYLQKAAACPVLYVQDDFPEIAHARRYPLEAVQEVCGDYLESSIAYAIALAITEGADEIALYGVDMKGSDEYAYQAPNCEFLLGLAKGRGIKVHIPPMSPLLKFSGSFGCVGRYGNIV